MVSAEGEGLWAGTVVGVVRQKRCAQSEGIVGMVQFGSFQNADI